MIDGDGGPMWATGRCRSSWWKGYHTPTENVSISSVDEVLRMDRHHNERFKGLMDKYMPQWKLNRDTLNSTPLAF
ncbi:MAG: Metal-dependent hydrolase [Magnetococcales bacterium]|nr:Metal-dependent hydrolase [Magnetococcales bacterium]